MCKTTRKLKVKQFTGYKLAYKIDDKYYSVCTGIEYKPKMKVEELGKNFKIPDFLSNLYIWFRNGNNQSHYNFKSKKFMALDFCHFYNIEAVGRTFVFRKKRDALENLTSASKPIVLKMTIEDDLIGSLLSKVYRCVGGRKIVEFKEC